MSLAGITELNKNKIKTPSLSYYISVALEMNHKNEIFPFFLPLVATAKQEFCGQKLWYHVEVGWFTVAMLSFLRNDDEFSAALKQSFAQGSHPDPGCWHNLLPFCDLVAKFGDFLKAFRGYSLAKILYSFQIRFPIFGQLFDAHYRHFGKLYLATLMNHNSQLWCLTKVTCSEKESQKWTKHVIMLIFFLQPSRNTKPWLQRMGNLGMSFPRNFAIWREI